MHKLNQMKEEKAIKDILETLGGSWDAPRMERKVRTTFGRWKRSYDKSNIYETRS